MSFVRYMTLVIWFWIFWTDQILNR